MTRRLGLPLILLLAFGASACGEDEPTRDEQGAVAEDGDLGVLSIRVGDCFDDDEGLASGELVEVDAVAAVPCEEPHDNEAYHLFDLAEGEFPGDDEVTEESTGECIDAFETYVGIGYEESVLEVFPITPSEESWEQGDREVICAAYRPDDKLTGSVADTAE